MNNFYTLHHVAKFLDAKLRGAGIVSVLSRKKRLLEINLTTNGIECQLVFQSSLTSALFLQDGMNDSRTNAASVFEDAWTTRVNNIRLDSDDRIVHLELTDGFSIRFVLFGPNANAYLFHHGELSDTFRNTSMPESRTVYERGDVSTVERAIDARSRILARDPRFPRGIVERIVTSRGLDSLPAAELCMVVDSMADRMIAMPEHRLLADNTICLLGDEYVSDPDSKSYPDVNALVRACWVQREIRDKFTSRKNQVAADLAAAKRKYEAMAAGLNDDAKSIQRADHHETIGHILMAHSYLDVPTSEIVELDDVFNPGNKVSVKVKPGSSFSENAQAYYIKSKNARKTLEANKSRLVDIRSKLALVDSLHTSYLGVDGPRTLDRWLKTNEPTLNLVLPGRRTAEGTSKPWREHQIGKFEVWIGKSASGNDELLQASHKEDVWLHARHVSGSHVVIRMGRSAEYPPTEVIETAASWAAWYSKAKTANMVPVIFTKRKYVRKPKGAAPGTALVDKEQVCLVEPSKPSNSTVE